ncbi:MAG: DUF4339 domain-containing protein [Algoriphagus sp.]|uniref:DUF4339 domain-containing protein n=1 Tax=Algoriphagus sp. TaxID=1872435 RepID=UPI0017F6C4A0|nr:DUF4339 domain-containing protein [Algoriphagus sp.]NVJ85785.1 DUF4339 domain-containing protein [Algoriphagus sp.]
MESTYYYLDGIERRGPYTASEIKSRKLNIETLILKDGENKWEPLEKFEELLEKKFDSDKIKEKDNEVLITTDTSEKQENKIRIPKILFWFLGVLVCLFISYFVIDSQKSEDLAEFNKKIDLVFEGKSSISDYDLKGTKGKMYDVELSTFFQYYSNLKNDPGEKTVVHTSEHLIGFKDDPNVDEEQWDYISKFVEYYEAEKFSGFSTYKLNKESEIFSITYCWSGDMAYSIGEFKILPGYKSPYFSVPDSKVSTFRDPIHVAYEKTAKFLIVENEDNSYSQGSLSKISDFPYLKSEFYEIEQQFPKYYRGIDTVHVQFKDYTSYLLDTDKISKNTSRNDSKVFNDEWTVWYKCYTNRYYISEIENIFYKKVLIYFSISSLLFSAIFYFFINRKKIQVV